MDIFRRFRPRANDRVWSNTTKIRGEKIWFNKLPENLKIKLKKLDN